MDRKHIQELFLKSALSEENPYIDINGVKKWLDNRRDEAEIRIEKIRFSDMGQWFFDQKRGNLRHISDKFFSIDGIHVETNWGLVDEWCQPIVNQPEIGLLGIITRKIKGILYFLMQAKVEPGNINSVQLSPTLQATRSNYTRVHQGKAPLYLEYFLEGNKKGVLIDQLQSEQGTRFLKKRNRNMIVQVDEDIPVYGDFIWLTLGQIKKLMRVDNTVNMDTRAVISCVPIGEHFSDASELKSQINGTQAGWNEFKRDMLLSSFDTNAALYNLDEILSWLTRAKSTYELKVDKIPLADVLRWEITDREIRHEENKFFKIIPFSVEINHREVERWTQPLVAPAQEGLIAFIVKKINDIYHFLVQAKLECGNLDILELAPTVQCLTGNYRDTKKGSLPYLEYTLHAEPSQIRFDTMQSEEGGRFYKEQNRNLIIEAENDFDETTPENYIWMTLGQLKFFLKFNNYVNVQTRSLISAIDFI